MSDRDELRRLRALRDHVRVLLARARAGERPTVGELTAALYGPPTERAGVVADTPDPSSLDAADCRLEDTDRLGRPGQVDEARPGQLDSDVESVIRDKAERSSGTGSAGRKGQRGSFIRDSASDLRNRYPELSPSEAEDFARSLREPTDPPVLWFTVRGYRCSFDLRADASRFIVLARPGVLLAQGLLADESCLLDRETGQLPAGLEQELIRVWTTARLWMRERAKGRNDGSPTAEEPTEEYPTD